jgi:hypothetical protein
VSMNSIGVSVRHREIVHAAVPWGGLALFAGLVFTHFITKYQ